MGRVVVVRHAETTWNAERRWSGHSDAPLSDLGRAQAAALGAAHVGQVDRVVASDLSRARDTAEAVRAACGLTSDVVVDPRLRERELGAWEGLTSPEIDERWPRLLEGWRTGVMLDIPGGEPWDDFLARVTDGLAALGGHEGTTLVVTHGGVFRAIEAAYDLPFRRMANADSVVLELA